MKNSRYIFLAGVLFLAVGACETTTPAPPVSSPRPQATERFARMLNDVCVWRFDVKPGPEQQEILRRLSNGVTIDDWCECWTQALLGNNQDGADQFLVDFEKYDNLGEHEPYKTRSEDAEVYCAAGKNPT